MRRKNLDKKKDQARVRRYRDNNMASYLLTKARRRALVQGLRFNITEDNIVIPATCPVLGIPLFRGPRNNPNSPTIDRINNKKGYTPRNVMVISYRANVLKRDATISELRSMAKFYGSM